jgi:hypothetical protein
LLVGRPTITGFIDPDGMWPLPYPIRQELGKLEKTYDKIVYDTKKTLESAKNAVVDFVTGLFEKTEEVKEVRSVDGSQTSPQVSDRLWLGDGPPQFNPNAKAEGGSDGQVMVTEGGMTEVAKSSKNSEARIQDTKNVGDAKREDKQSPKQDTIWGRSGPVENASKTGTEDYYYYYITVDSKKVDSAYYTGSQPKNKKIEKYGKPD